MKSARKIHIRGLVQGVGFRPFIYRLATSHMLNGWVENNNEGVIIWVEGPEEELKAFISNIPRLAPPASGITALTEEIVEPVPFTGFSIKKSEDRSSAITGVSPDIAVCSECLEEMRSQAHRIDYPFINCTNCGPRFTIIHDLPYDRPMTTMEPFDMCPRCSREYNDILDRRFHAQPIACNHCGPSYALHTSGKLISDLTGILHEMSKAIDNGKIIAMKGLGGYHLACDALNENAVDRLRKAKNRDGKPFAVMFRDTEAASKYAYLSDEEEELLESWRRPILLLNARQQLAPGVSVGFDTVGGMLPYLPFHHLLFENLRQDAIVLTSGNISDEPIIIDNNEALERLGPITDMVLTNNRDIYNRTDDSVAIVVNGSSRIIRRSRSWVPSPVDLNIDVDGILACGAELVNCFCLGKGFQAILSQHIGDLKNAETLEFYTESIGRLQRLFRVEPSLIVHDFHPDYLSSRFAMESSLPKVAVQHHHAHIAACMAEHGLDERVIGISFDGVGLGTDGNIWGGEFLFCELHDFERWSHLDYAMMPGGDMATKEPWRMALSFLYKTFGDDYKKLNLPLFSEIDPAKINFLEQAIRQGINAPLTSSAGRLFDAVAAITGLCTYSKFHAEAPMRLESAIEKREKGVYPFSIQKAVDTSHIIRGVSHDMLEHVPVPIIAARFHNSVINIIFEAAEKMSAKTGIRKVVMSGGSFQNKYILERAEEGLQQKGFKIFSPQNIPANDGGIALGQLAIAAAKRRNGSI